MESMTLSSGSRLQWLQTFVIEAQMTADSPKMNVRKERLTEPTAVTMKWYGIKMLLLLLLMVLSTFSVTGQHVMRITQTDGSVWDVPIANIDSVSFVTVEEPEHKASLEGIWKWEGQEEGYSETLTFRADGTYTCLDHYYAYDFDSQTYGTYMFFGSMLTLRSNGYGYNRYYQWMVTELTDDRLTVMTKMGRFTYCRVK